MFLTLGFQLGMYKFYQFPPQGISLYVSRCTPKKTEILVAIVGNTLFVLAKLEDTEEVQKLITLKLRKKDHNAATFLLPEEDLSACSYQFI